jgi:hypothetical protein
VPVANTQRLRSGRNGRRPLAQREGGRTQWIRGRESLSQIEWGALWIARGGNPAKAREASAIVMAESGGDVDIYNGSCCYGGYQINLGNGDVSLKCATDPVCATDYAIKLSSNGKDWTPWQVWTEGSYAEFMDTAPSTSQLASFDLGDALGDIFGSGLDPLGGGAGGSFGGIDVPNPLNGLKEIAAFFVGLGELLLTPDGWIRIGKILGGALALLFGLNVLVKQTTGVNVGGTAKRAAGFVGAAKIAQAVT